jgi:hypothetical protein
MVGTTNKSMAVMCGAWLCRKVPSSDQTAICSLFRLLVRIDHVARLVLRRRYHDLGRDVLELADIGALDALELHLK